MICARGTQVDIRKLGKTLPQHIQINDRWIAITTTACNLGGHRHWFLCPKCSRRCAILYPVACRTCAQVDYATLSMSPLDRKITAAIKVRTKLGQKSGGTCVPFPDKPKLMRWHTYFRIRAKALAAEQEMWECTARVCGFDKR